MMHRRELLRALAAAGAAATLPSWAAGTADEFDRAVRDKPWLQPFKGVSDRSGALDCAALSLRGTWPAELRGRFYRNGPALFERGGQRVQHWFAGDGMVQQFTFGDAGVSHRGRLVQTTKLQAEREAGRFLFNAFGRVEGAGHAGGPDSFNTANTNALEHGGRVLAMWEGGSAIDMDPHDLSTRGPVTWGEGLQQVPFSAHPKVDSSGHLWNIGTQGTKLIAWHVDPQGRLAGVQIGDSPYPNGMVHDMAVTPRYLVVPLPPLRQDFAALQRGAGVEQGFRFEPDQPLRILVMRKDDIQQRRVFELPAQFVFHVGNAHETADGQVVLSFIGADDHRTLVHNAVALVAGEDVPLRISRTQTVRMDMANGQWERTVMDDEVEFPRVDPRRIGLPARLLLTCATWRPRGTGSSPLFHGVQLRDLQTGRVERHDYGQHTLVEEHVLVPKPGRSGERDAWLLGTTIDLRTQRTTLNLLDAARVADGPLAQATLPYLLPPGFHGNFSPR